MMLMKLVIAIFRHRILVHLFLAVVEARCLDVKPRCDRFVRNYWLEGHLAVALTSNDDSDVDLVPNFIDHW